MPEDRDVLPLQVGELRGRLDGMDNRFNRFEDFVGSNLRDIRETQKMDGLHLNAKLDKIIEAQSKGAGGWGVVRWVLAVAASGSGWLAFMLGGRGL